MTDQLLLRARPTVVVARRITKENRADVIQWLNEEVSAWTYGTQGITWHQDDAMHDAFLGDWIVRNPWGEYHQVSDAVLFARFEAVVPVVSE